LSTQPHALHVCDVYAGSTLDERHPSDMSLVTQESTKLGERPGMNRGPLGLTKPYPATDPRQLLDGDAAPGALSLRPRCAWIPDG
jgi:hypothetical protein